MMYSRISFPQDRKEKESIMKQQYDEPFFLTKTEFNEVVHKECPETLQRVKDVFVVQCCFGCRIGDFRRFTFDNISIEEGIPYIHYLPQKHTRMDLYALR